MTHFQASDFRIRGTTSSKEGLTHAITIRPLDDYGNPAPLDLPYDVIGVILTHRFVLKMLCSTLDKPGKISNLG